MGHKNIHRKFGREADHRMAMLKNQVISLVEHGRIHTTDAKAEEVHVLVERIVTLGKRGDLHARRLAYRTVPNRELISKIFDQLAVRFKDRPGGYTRIIKTAARVGDCAPMSILEFLPETNA